ncbi:cobalt-precorrin-6A reductase [Sulfitobacter donghicola]|uniref:Cobalt-precorrin-6x reductase n=1 Tax=Sulfitobacter donghicola DSW-25 = KCTC 12864 = JCM 14565 TaxID=1300350 RepID=A0A073IJR0_9RHOB|nr:cobalt-precorrin-6A reductase [Sulfitobacter donghicola]KEJ90513.1 cobalt-precorrin-6x reductase [Sulfitobacter donghicola DSW-25 = KCTC 12864 = JCM 14565]KIN67755.1 Precorrin-6x reductase [Sulfitobacter donghicola DSW-25 = KCTC 12864 = JCM 14565]
MHVLLLGGTTEASKLAHALKLANIETVFSYAGRTNTPVAQPVPTRIGGFGGIEGLQRFLGESGITHVVDATHPFAAQMSLNAFTACKTLGLPLLRLQRPPWLAQNGDDWIDVADIEAACDALPDTPSRVFLAIGRMHIDLFARKPQHHYLLRLVDEPMHPIALPNHTAIIARGPFDIAGDIKLLRGHGIGHVVAKNAGGAGAVAKIDAARELGLRMIMVARPDLPDSPIAANSDEVLQWLRHSAERGV